jgi:hypothetical protein
LAKYSARLLQHGLLIFKLFAVLPVLHNKHNNAYSSRHYAKASLACLRAIPDIFSKIVPPRA